jgi:hypothetical protein
MDSNNAHVCFLVTAASDAYQNVNGMKLKRLELPESLSRLLHKPTGPTQGYSWLPSVLPTSTQVRTRYRANRKLQDSGLDAIGYSQYVGRSEVG